MSNQTIELISFNLCPFVQRSVITLLKKGIDFKITYIDLANKPDWFLKISPLGKVPVLRYGEEVLFESAVINEFLDEITPNSLMPSQPLDKAKDRSWIEYSSQVIMSQYMMSVASNEQDYQQHTEALFDKLQKLEHVVDDTNYFSGESFTLTDSALAPLFTRFQIIADRFNKNLLSDFPKLSQLAKRYLSLDYVKKSVIDDFADVYVDYLKDRNSLLAA